MIAIESLDHLVLTVASIERSCAFYETVLGMRREVFGADRVALRFGQQKINLHEVGHEFEPRALLATAGSADLCFLTGTSLAEVEAHFIRLGVAIELGPVLRAGAVGSILSLYTRDPDGNLIEIANPSRESGATG